MHDLLSVESFVEAPFIIVKIGKYTFGNVSKSGSNKFLSVTYPNYMKSIEVVKINGQVNTYSIKMEYPITPGDDPNLLDKVFGSVSDTRMITISYGDWSAPSFIFKEETAIITDVQSTVDFASPRITYSISAVSNSISLASSVFNFPAITDKPSNQINRIINNSTYGIKSTFKGMQGSTSAIANLIDSDDMTVDLEPQPCTSVLDYLNYLVNCMKSYNSDAVYRLTFVDDNISGSYFKVGKVTSNVQTSTLEDSYTIDVGYPGNNFVTSFAIKDTSEWSILYNYAKEMNQESYTYKINNLGEMEKKPSLGVTRNKNRLRTEAEDETWWRAVTEFPISATIVIKGLVRPTTLMSYITLNCVFYGQKHISSGVYIVNKETDSIGPDGYKTTLELIRVKGDKDLNQKAQNSSNVSNSFTGGGAGRSFNAFTGGGGGHSF